ncbi:MAG: CbtB domain-containing protein [Nitrososphaeraceae archaeon]
MIVTKKYDGVPRIALGILVSILLFGMFIVGYDQGYLFSLAEGQKAFDDMWLHEFSHDLRHAAGFPCH